MRSLLVNECGIDPARFISILHFDGAPITARFIIATIAERLSLISREAAE
jgi:2-oxoglutarate ferredoxin oxidoreductase subunit alpha